MKTLRENLIGNLGNLGNGETILYEFICPECGRAIYSLEEKFYWWCARCNLFLAEKSSSEIKCFYRIQEI